MTQRTFTLDDQIDFANMSGDFNPIHLDPLVARRLIYGKPVVHGINTLLWCLNHWLSMKNEKVNLHSLKALFKKPIGINERAECLVKDDGKKVSISVCLEAVTVLSSNFTYHTCDNLPSNLVHHAIEKNIPDKLTAEDIASCSGQISTNCDVGLLEIMYPDLVKKIDLSQISQIIVSSTLVGMKCPGLNSVYSEVKMSFNGEDKNNEQKLSYNVQSFDKRFNLAHLEIDSSNMSGSIKAFLRPEPQKQASYSEFLTVVEKDEFIDKRALIIGGSRGLGEVTAKLLSAGGAEIVISYFKGYTEAQSLLDDILANGGKAKIFQFDITAEENSLVEALGENWTITHLYYFPTPFIFEAEKGIFSSQIYNRFSLYYITGFNNLICQLLPHGLKKVFYPSSAAIDELPLNMGEYSAAKMAGETLCDFLEKTHRDLKIFKPRIPRMKTDQTATFMPVPANEPIFKMIEYIRQLG